MINGFDRPNAAAEKKAKLFRTKDKISACTLKNAALSMSQIKRIGCTAIQPSICDT